MDGLKGLAMEGSSAKNEKKVLKIGFYLFFGGFCLLCWLYSCLLSFCMYAH